MSVSHVHKRNIYYVYTYMCVCVSMWFIHGYSSTCIEYITYQGLGQISLTLSAGGDHSFPHIAPLTKGESSFCRTGYHQLIVAMIYPWKSFATIVL